LTSLPSPNPSLLSSSSPLFSSDVTLMS
jgi:hypothetical protein